jgi:hypothetical protein
MTDHPIHFMLQIVMAFSSIGCAKLLVGALTFIMSTPLRASTCANSDSAVATSAWRSITPPKEDVEVVYLSPSGWVGLNHIYAGRQVLTHRRRRLVPWMVPQITTIFPFSHALESPANEMPLFYVDHLDTAAYLSDSDARAIHLLRLRAVGKERELEATSGASVFNFKPGFSSHSVIPLRVNILSNTVFTIQPEQRLPDGEYLIVLGPVASSGFEFQISCPVPNKQSSLK